MGKERTLIEGDGTKGRLVSFQKPIVAAGYRQRHGTAMVRREAHEEEIWRRSVNGCGESTGSSSVISPKPSRRGRGIMIAGDTRPCMIADLSKAFVQPLWKYRTDLYARL
jgi:hypothetical protein